MAKRIESSEQCTNCRWWNRARRASWTDVGEGGHSYVIEHAQCRRYAPSRLSGNDRADRGWPEVNANDWCGDHSPLPGVRYATPSTPG